MGDPYYRGVSFINHQLNANTKILMLGEARTYGIHKPHFAATLFDENMFENIILKSENMSDIYLKLKEQGITHILYNENEWSRLNQNYAHFFPSHVAGYFRIESSEKRQLILSFIENLKHTLTRQDFKDTGLIIKDITAYDGKQ